MAKFTFFEVSCGSFNDPTTGSVQEYDKVNLMFSKRVNRKNMKGEKGEIYSVPVSDIPYLFDYDVEFPGPVNGDYTRRIDSVGEFLEPFLGKCCTVEEISKNDKKIISYLEFDE